MNHPYPSPSQQAHLQQDMHQMPRPGGAYPPPHQMQQQLPPMPPPAAYQQDYIHGPAPGQGQPPPSQPPVAAGPDGSQQEGNSPPQQPTKLTAEQELQQKANLEPYSSTDEQGRKYSLDVVQQPQRARMCGFGDKDRRPITPPPCVRLVIRDAATGKEIDCNDIEHTMYVLNVDLWSEDALREVNLVRHTTATPSISSTTPASYAQVEATTPAFTNILPSSNPHGQMGYGNVPSYMPQQGYSPSGYGGYGPPTQFFPHHHDFRQELQASMPHLPTQAGGFPRYDGGYMPNQRMSIGGGQPQGMFTRNLIGSLAASAFRLSDTDDKIGIWFVLQDLSVRTEGLFRLRFSFVNVGVPPSNGSINGNPSVNTGKAPVLASAFSDVFQVFSAKKFPGVCESTSLSKCFATQGIKIPIRKEGSNAKGNQEDDDDY